MADDSVDLDIFDQLAEDTGETAEAGAPELPQDGGWIDPLNVRERPA